MKLYAVTGYYPDDGDYYTDFYMADDNEHAEEQAKNENSPDYKILVCRRVPFYMVERAYIIESKANKGGE